MKRVLVTGGNGFLGKHVCAELQKRDLAWLRAPSSLELNLLRDSVFLEVLQADVVIHLAAKCGGIGLNQQCPGQMFRDNMQMGMNVLEACRMAWCNEPAVGAKPEEPKKLIMIGSVCSYPEFAPTPFREESLWSGYPEPTNAPYGIAKRALLTMSQAYRQEYGLNVITLIPTNLYGPGDKFDDDASHVIPAVIKKLVQAKEEERPSVTFWGTGDASRDFLHVRDAARAIVMAMEQYDEPMPLNLGSGKQLGINVLAWMIAQKVGYTGHIYWDSTKPDGQMRRAVNASAAARAIGFTPQIGFDEGLTEVIEWWRSRAERNVVSA